MAAPSLAYSSAPTNWNSTFDNLLEDLETSSQNSKYKQASSSRGTFKQQHQFSSSSVVEEVGSTEQNSTKNLSSQTKSSVQKSRDMLKNLEGSLKASKSYIESHRSVSGPAETSEYHEYRSYSSGGQAPTEIDSGFNLEKQVQHMMPTGNFKPDSYGAYPSDLQSTSMVKQQQQQNFTTYRVQTNSYDSNGKCVQMDYPADGDRPGSHLKQNIDELDNLLLDLNNAKKISDVSGDYTGTSITPGNLSSDDYSFHDGRQGHLKKSFTSYNTTEMQILNNDRKPPSPTYKKSSGSHFQNQPSNPVTINTFTAANSESRKAEHSNFVINNDQQQITSSLGPDKDGIPTGVSYYAKYHSTHSHQSQNQPSTPPPIVFPSGTGVSIANKPQTPPKKVNELMTELSEFDSSIRHTTFEEPEVIMPQKSEPSFEPYKAAPFRPPSPSIAQKQENIVGPAVYYPPGDIFQSNTVRNGSDAHQTSGGNKIGQGKRDFSYRGKEKNKHVESDGKQGAAVVPICLPLCCAAPCVIM